MKRTNLRALATFSVWVLVSGVGSLAPTLSYAATPCGAAGQRACCVGERIPSCNAGLREVLGCTGECTCGGVNPFGAANSIGHCEAPPPPPQVTSCGGPGQRACCVGERIPSCNAGLREVLGCTGNCTCGGVNPGGLVNSIGHCEAPPPPPQITGCGGPGQRACCVGERIPSCNAGLHEVMGCTGNCTCGGPNPGGLLNSIGHCEASPPPPQITGCGGAGQRACCVGERIPSCNAGLHEVMGCTGNCTCGGPNPGGHIKSIGHCEGSPQPTMSNCQSALAALAAANQAVQLHCAQAGGAQQVAPATKQPVRDLPVKQGAPGGLQKRLIK